jgi:hypothetical protein
MDFLDCKLKKLAVARLMTLVWNNIQVYNN